MHYLTDCFSLPLSDQWTRMNKVLKCAGHVLVPVKDNLIDAIWVDRPPRPSRPLMTLGFNFTGKRNPNMFVDTALNMVF